MTKANSITKANTTFDKSKEKLTVQISGCRCGMQVIDEIKCTKYREQYGPVFWGNFKLEKYSRWDVLLSNGVINNDEKAILIAMSENESNMDGVQSYDSEILTAGAMQKTINSEGSGELPRQMYKFKKRYPKLFQQYFVCCGWDVNEAYSGKNETYIATYKGKTGHELKILIREGCNKESYGKKVKNKALAIFVEAIMLDEYQDIQVEDFIDRLNKEALAKIPNGYIHRIGDYIKSNLGKATILDQDVNRPGYVRKDFAEALNYFYKMNPYADKNPMNWKENHSAYESEIVEYYGNHRRGIDMVNRFNRLKSKL